VVVTSSEDFERAVLDFTDGKGVDLAIDSYGATMLDRTFNVVKKLGHVVSIGEAEGQPFKNIRERILPRSQTFTRLHLGHVDHACRNGRRASTTCWAGICRRLAESARLRASSRWPRRPRCTAASKAATSPASCC
jgi:NADPH2:quinone reductase